MPKSTNTPSNTSPPRRPASLPNVLSNRQRGFLQQLKLLGFTSYGRYLDSEQWREVKARYRASNAMQVCLVCHDPNVDLHHKTYKRIGRELLTDLVPLCSLHHDVLHSEGLGLWVGPKQLRERARARPTDGAS